MVKNALFRPLAALGELLGRGFKTHMTIAPGDREYQRYWPCGCKATYRDEREPAASWMPCDQHMAWSADHH